MFTSPKRYFNLTKALTISEFKLRDQGTFLGFLWTILYPLSMFLVLYAIFSKWMGNRVDNFPSYLLIGIVFWNFFTISTTNALTIINRKSELVKNLNFPKEILIISNVLTVFISFILELIILLIFLHFLNVHYSLNIIFLPFIICVELILVLGISFLLSPLHVYYRDIERIWGILMMLGFFLTPIFYPLSIIDVNKQKIMLLNPMLHIITAARDCLLYQKPPHFRNLLLVLSVALIIFLLGYYLFRKRESNFAEYI